MTRLLMTSSLLALAVACAPTGAESIPCRKSAQCPSGHSCSAEGLCVEGTSGLSGELLVVQPQSVTVKAGTTQTFKALLDEEETTSVTWMVEGEGSISATGVYTPPAHVTSPLTARVLAALSTDGARVASALVTVTPAAENVPPVILSLNPSSVPIGSATVALQVEGAGFVSSSKVHVGTTPLTTTYESATRLVATLPAAQLQSAAELSVTVHSPAPGGGASNVQAFTVLNPLPALTAMSPTQADLDAGELVLTVDGTGFVQSSTVYFDEQPLSTQRLSATRLQATVPAGLLTSGRAAAVDVRTPGPGGGDAADLIFNVRNPSASTGSVSPSSVRAGSSNVTLTVTGASFRPGATVHFDGQPVSAQWVSATQVTVALPSALTALSRTLQLKVVNTEPGGGGANSIPFRISPVLQTVAGHGTVEGKPATSVPVTFDAWARASGHAAVHPVTGELYYAECHRHRVMRVDAQGLVRRVAGDGYCGGSGEGGPALNAQLCCPNAIAFNAAGELFVSNDWSDKLVKIAADAARTFSTILDGDSVQTMASLAVHPITQQLYISNCGGDALTGNSVQRLEGTTLVRVAGNSTYASSGDGGPATDAALMCPAAIAWDSQGRLYIAESEGGKVRRVDGAGVISTFAGTGASGDGGNGGAATLAQLDDVTGLAVDANDNVYVSQFTSRVIRKISGGIITHLAGRYSENVLDADGALADTAHIGHVGQLFWGMNGQLHFGTSHEWGQDYAGIKRIDETGRLRTVVGARPVPTTAADSMFTSPNGIAVDAGGNVYVASFREHQVYRVDASGAMTVLAGKGLSAYCGDNGPATSACLHNPKGIWRDNAGNLYIADSSSARVRRVDPQGMISTIAGADDWPAGCPGSMPSSPPPGAGPGYNCIGDDYLATHAQIVNPVAVVGDNAGNLYIAEGEGQSWSYPGTGNRVRKLDLLTGVITTIAGSTAPEGGTCGFSGDGGQATGAALCGVAGLALDPQGDLLVSDGQNRRIRKVRLKTAPLGQISTIAGDGANRTGGDGGQALAASFDSANGVACDPAGNIYVADFDANNIRRIAPTGIITTIAGSTSGGDGFSPDGTEPTAARLRAPQHIAVSPDGQTLYFTDDNHLLRRMGL